MARLRGGLKERLEKSREAMIGAVSIYNSPTLSFKSETFITLSIIAWTYLMHAYYQSRGIEFRYFKGEGPARRYSKTKYGAHRYWELEKCINASQCPLDDGTKNNLYFLIGIRHEIEHQLTHQIDDHISAKLQACAQNYEYWICQLFGNKHSIADSLAIAVQLSPLDIEQKKALSSGYGLSANVRNFVAEFEGLLSPEEMGSLRYAYRVVFTQVSANHPGQADKVVNFIPADSPLAKDLDAEYTLIKQTEKEKYRPSDVVAKMKELGYAEFSMYDHTNLWKSKNAKRPETGFGVSVRGQWYWYESWVNEVKKWCERKYQKKQSAPLRLR